MTAKLPALAILTILGTAILGTAILGVGGCGAGAPPYAECIDDLDCGPPSDGCYRLLYSLDDGTSREGNQCSRACATDEDCPDSGACVSLADDPERRLFCAARCAEPGDCYAGLRCTMVEGATRTMQICLP